MRSLGCVLLLILIGASIYLFGSEYVRRHPQDFPWTSLSLGDPVGRFTASKIAALGDEPAQCRALLAEAGLKHEPAPERRPQSGCGYVDGMRLADGGLSFLPVGLVTSCPVAAAIHLLGTRVIEPAAQRHFGREVTQVLHAGSYSCRRLYGRSEGEFSQHATADALDIVGFRLDGGRHVSVLNDWGGNAPEAEFLREVRDGACRLFPTVLSPDYNEAHRDHLHLDVADRGMSGWTVCR